MARMCGILRIALREDDPGCKLRLHPEDVVGETARGQPIAPGLYSCSRDAFEKFGPRMLERLKQTPAIGHDGKPVFDEEGKPVMCAPAGTTLQTIPPTLLC